MGLLDPFDGLRKSMSAKPLRRAEPEPDPASAESIAEAVVSATAPAPLPEYEKETKDRSKEKTETSSKTRDYKALSEPTQSLLEERWLQEPTSQMQIKSLMNLREKINNFVSDPLNTDTSALLQFGDLMTRGKFNLSERFSPAMGAAERVKLINDMEKVYQNSVADVQKSKNDWVKTQTKGFTEQQNKQVNQLMNETGQIWRDVSASTKGKNLNSTELDKASGFDEAYSLLRQLEDAYYRTYEDGVWNPSKMANYGQMSTFVAQKIGKALEGKMTDEDFKRIRGLLPGWTQAAGLGQAKVQFEQLYQLIDSQKDIYIDMLEQYGRYVPKNPGLPVYGGPDVGPVPYTHFKGRGKTTTKSSKTTKKNAAAPNQDAKEVVNFMTGGSQSKENK